MKAGLIIFIAALIFSCSATKNYQGVKSLSDTLTPEVVTEKVYDDPDDPAIWINTKYPDSSIIIGTDKHKDSGGLYVFNLLGKIDSSRSVLGMKRVNNVDIAYGLQTSNGPIDIAVCTERDRNSIRIFRLPDMKPIDSGGIEVFVGEKERLPMGVALYTRPNDGNIFAIVGRKSGPLDGYLEQYQLKDSSGIIVGEKVRTFGKFSGKKEIESIAVDNELGYVYYSDEVAGIRKYYADPANGNDQLALFGVGEFSADNEGISIYKTASGTGYILVSDQSSNTFNIYPREGIPGNANLHKRIKIIKTKTLESDGSDISSISLPGYPGGLFVAMSDNGTFQFYSWKSIAEKSGLQFNKN